MSRMEKLFAAFIFILMWIALWAFTLYVGKF